MKIFSCCMAFILFAMLYVLFYGALFGFTTFSTKKEESVKNVRLPRSLWWNYETLRIIKPYLELMKQIEELEEKLKEEAQARRDKIYREKLVSQIRSKILHDFLTTRY